MGGWVVGRSIDIVGETKIGSISVQLILIDIIITMTSIKLNDKFVRSDKFK